MNGIFNFTFLNRLTALFLLGIISFSLAGCKQLGYTQSSDFEWLNPLQTNQTGLQKRELTQKREQWAAQKITNYRYTIKLFAFSPDGGKSVLIEVRDGKQVSLTCIDCELKYPKIFTNLDTVEKLFDRVGEEIENEENYFEVKYDEKLGYPTFWQGESKRPVTDSLWKYEISKFEVIK